MFALFFRFVTLTLTRIPYSLYISAFTDFEVDQPVISFAPNVHKAPPSSARASAPEAVDPQKECGSAIAPMGIVCVQQKAIQLFNFTAAMTFPPAVLQAKQARKASTGRSGSDANEPNRFPCLLSYSFGHRWAALPGPLSKTFFCDLC